jgi:hypothetical protein
VTPRRAELSLPPDKPWNWLYVAFALIGKIEDASDAAKFLVGKARYGRNLVRHRISILSDAGPASSVLDKKGQGQDVMGVASRKVINRLLVAL